ncbi:MAG: signal peptidase I [Candidatus Andersenbacteria bacterium]|nr:signal peptidase I [bacterium]MDZ4225372.1 signal peptidase I [Candidatus Andersenbacteria bacterium]
MIVDQGSRKLIRGVVYYVVLALLIVVAVFVLFSATGLPGSGKILVVRTGSMEPTISAGGLITIVPEVDYKEGDIITFKKELGADLSRDDATVTHRIVGVNDEEGEKLFSTKGDANDVEDSQKVVRKQIIGRVIFSIPYVGYLVSFAKTQLGFILLIVIPATIIVYSEILTIKREVKEKLAKRRERKMEVVDSDLTEEEEA